MDKTFKITVTQEDLAMGFACNVSACAVARAASRAIGREVKVGFLPHVAGVCMIWETESGRYMARLPTEVETLVYLFDLGMFLLNPCEFEVTPEPYDYTEN